MPFVNCTPHRITIYERRTLRYSPETSSYNLTERSRKLMELDGSSRPARCYDKMTVEENLDGVPVLDIRYGNIVNLPPPSEGVTYLTSVIVAREAAKAGRTDILVPSRIVRDDFGRVVGCASLSRV